MRSSRTCQTALSALLIAFAAGFTMVPSASADDDSVGPAQPGPVQVLAGPTSDDAAPAAVSACSTFAQVLDGSSNYYGDFADSLEGSGYTDPAVDSSNQVGRTALRQAAGVAMDAANTPGLQPEISDPIRTWSVGATKLLVKMGLRIPGDSLNNTATAMNDDATRVQEACAAAGTHA